MTPDPTRLPLSRRDLLKLGGAAAALAPGVSAGPAWAQTPKRGGTLTRPPLGSAPLRSRT